MLMPLLFAALIQAMTAVGAPAAPDAVTWEAAHPALMAKAPGAPGYGVQITTAGGRIVFTSLCFNPETRLAQAKFYRIGGNAGSGPYRLGLEVGFHPREPIKGSSHPSWFDNFFTMESVRDGSPAKAAGLGPDKYGPRWSRVVIEAVDGSNFDWDLGKLVWHITNSPVVELSLIKRPLLGGPSRWKTKVTLARIDTPPDPADGYLEPSGSGPALIQPWLGAPRMWRDLLTLRSGVARFAPLPMDLSGGRRWVVLGQSNPEEQDPAKVIRCLEVWKEDPLVAPEGAAPVDLWPETPERFQAGRVVRIENQWYRIQAMAQEPGTGRLVTFNLSPWEADVPALLAGSTLAAALGTQASPQPRETLEQLGNRALLEWKTRTLPTHLASMNRQAGEDLVLRIEQGLLDLDLEVKGIRSRLDAAARAEIELKAQQELAAKNGQPVPAGAARPSAESERVADLLDQRKAILMAALGSAKQALATLRK